MNRKSTWDYEEALLHWQERMHRLRLKYRGLPGAYTREEDPEKEQSRIAEELSVLQARNSLYLEPVLLKRWKRLAGDGQLAGRDAEITAIRKAFQEGRGPVFLYGIGGIGKSAIAGAYAAREEENYEQILTLVCGTNMEELICDDTLTLVPVHGMAYQEDRYGSRRRYFREKMETLRVLVSQKETLLILDDWNWPSGRGWRDVLHLPCDILVTTRRNPSAWGMGAEIPVDSLQTEAQWEEFFQKNSVGELSEKERKKAEAYCREVGGHTMRMLLYLRGEGAQAGKNMLAGSGLQLTEAEKQCLRELCVLPAQGISRALYREISGTTERTLEALREKLLLQFFSDEDGEEWISLHPVIAEETRQHLSPNTVNCRRLLQRFSEITDKAWTREGRENQPYVCYVQALLRAFPDAPPWLLRTYDRLLILLLMQEYTQECLPLYRKLVDTAIREYGKEHQMTGEMQLRLAAAYFNAQMYEKADPWYEQAYETLHTCTGRDASWSYVMAVAAGKMSRLARSRRDYEAALSYVREALELTERQLLKGTGTLAVEELDSFTAKLDYYFWQMDLGRIFLRTGQPEESDEIFNRMMRLLEKDCRAKKYFTETFASTEIDKFRLEFLTAGGRYEEAEELGEAMLDQALRERGEVHSYTLGIRLRLADLMVASGQTAQARAAYQSILALLQRKHPYWKEQIERVKRRLEAFET